jgi:hypothetical protein
MLKSAKVSKKEKVICPFGGLKGGYPRIPYNELPRGINNIKCKKKNKINHIINIRGFLFLPSKVIYPQSNDG